MSLPLSCISHYQWSIMHTRWKLNYSALLKRVESNGFQAPGITCTMHCACSVIGSDASSFFTLVLVWKTLGTVILIGLGYFDLFETYKSIFHIQRNLGCDSIHVQGDMKI